MIRHLLSLMLPAVLLSGVVAAGDRLDIGDKAPALSKHSKLEWVRGKRVQEFEKGKVYVLHHFSSWTDAFRSELYQLDVIAGAYSERVGFIAVSVLDPGATAEFAGEARSVLQEYPALASFSWALDHEYELARAYQYERPCTLFGHDGALWAFPLTTVIDGDGRAAWFGHLDEQFVSVLDQVLAGTWNRKEYARSEMRRWKSLCETDRDYQRFFGVRASRELKRTSGRKDLEAGLEATLEMLALPDSLAIEAVERFRLLLWLGDTEAALKVGREVVEGSGITDWAVLRRLSLECFEELLARSDSTASFRTSEWVRACIAAGGGADQDLVTLALDAAQACVRITGRRESFDLHLLALAHALQGHTELAIDLQREALSVAYLPWEKVYNREALTLLDG